MTGLLGDDDVNRTGLAEELGPRLSEEELLDAPSTDMGHNGCSLLLWPIMKKHAAITRDPYSEVS